MKMGFRRILSNLIFWSGMLLIAVIAVPAGICYVLISLIVKVMDLAVCRINKKGS